VGGQVEARRTAFKKRPKKKKKKRPKGVKVGYEPSARRLS
jgi:hypothetical protein